MRELICKEGIIGPGQGRIRSENLETHFVEGCGGRFAYLSANSGADNGILAQGCSLNWATSA
jgi:hypothetical protein